MKLADIQSDKDLLNAELNGKCPICGNAVLVKASGSTWCWQCCSDQCHGLGTILEAVMHGRGLQTVTEAKHEIEGDLGEKIEESTRRKWPKAPPALFDNQKKKQTYKPEPKRDKSHEVKCPYCGRLGIQYAKDADGHVRIAHSFAWKGPIEFCSDQCVRGKRITRER